MFPRASFVCEKIKSSSYSRYYTEACNKWWIHLCGLAPGQHSFEETSQRWRAVGDTVPDLTGLRIEILTSRTEKDIFNHCTNQWGASPPTPLIVLVSQFFTDLPKPCYYYLQHIMVASSLTFICSTFFRCGRFSSSLS